MGEEKKKLFMIGQFVFNHKEELYLRRSQSQNNKFTCLNSKLISGKNIQETISNSVKKKINLGRPCIR